MDGYRATCHVANCEQQLVVTKSWLNGPTLHACREHLSLLPEKKPGAERQAVLL